ncbi:MAG TPA: hypothetical protein VH054_01460 [Polyangiaceae bacterium]|jgi:hypothetical protein|nr:hypothetical protein [Polyangiaceae bacterium]
MSSVAVTRLTKAGVEAFVVFRRKMLEKAPWAFAATFDDDVALNPGFGALSWLRRSVSRRNGTVSITSTSG